MSYAGFMRCNAFAWLPNNDGQPAHTSNGDRGGRTAWGMPYVIYCAWCTQHRMPAPSVAEFDALQRTAFLPVFNAWNWKPVAGDRLLVGVDQMAYDHAFMSGAGNGIRLLLECANLDPGGHLDDDAIDAINAIAPVNMIEALHDAREMFLRADPDFHEFGGGWLRRNNECRELALSQAREA